MCDQLICTMLYNAQCCSKETLINNDRVPEGGSVSLNSSKPILIATKACSEFESG